MSRIETIQLEWFSVDEMLPEQNSEILIKTNWWKTCKSNYHEENQTYKITFDKEWNDEKEYKDITEWCYYPFKE